MLKDSDIKKVQRWADGRNAEFPEHLRDEYRIELELGPNAITIVSCEPPWPGSDEPVRMPVARLRFVANANVWRLYWVDSNDRFHLFEPFPEVRDVQSLLREIDADPTNIFWG
jgi:hypothetical protein